MVTPMNDDEKIDVVKAVVPAADDRIKGCSGVGTIRTAETWKPAVAVSALGVDALSVITPYFVSVSQDEPAGHDREIGAAVDLPVVLYNIPQRPGNRIDPELIYTPSPIENVNSCIDTANRSQRYLSILVGTVPPDADRKLQKTLSVYLGKEFT